MTTHKWSELREKRMARKAKQAAEEKPVEETVTPEDVTVGDEVAAAPVVEAEAAAEEHPRRKATCPKCNVGVAASTTVKSSGAYVYDCPECAHGWVA